MVAAVPGSGEASTCSQVTSGWETVNIVGSGGARVCMFVVTEP